MININPFKPYLWGAVAILVLSLGVSTWYYRNASQKHTAQLETVLLEKENALNLVKEKDRVIALKDKELAVLETTNNNHLENINKLRTQKEMSDDLLKQALKSNRSWSDTRLPDELRKHFETIQND